MNQFPYNSNDLCGQEVASASIMPKIPDTSAGIQMELVLTGIFGITSGGGPHISVGIFQPRFAVPILTNRFFALITRAK